ncbi:hypothetical protein [Pseudomonas sp. TE3610]
MTGKKFDRAEAENIAHSNGAKADSYPATVRLNSDYFGGQLDVPEATLTTIREPFEFTWFNAGNEKSKVAQVQLYFEGDLAPGRYLLSDEPPVWMNLAIRDAEGYPDPCFIKSGEVILEVFDRESKHVQGVLKDIVVEIKMGPTIVIGSGFFSSPPNKKL